MASSLADFLAVKDIDLKAKTIDVTAKDGSNLQVDIKALPIDQIKRIRAVNTFTYPKPDGTIGAAELDSVGYTLMIAVAGIAAPDLRDRKLLQKCGAQNSEQVLVSLFPIAEIAKIASEVENISVGENPIYNGTNPEKVDEAKNS